MYEQRMVTVVVRFRDAMPAEEREPALDELRSRGFVQDVEFGLVSQSSGLTDTLCVRGLFPIIRWFFYKDHVIDGVTVTRDETIPVKTRLVS